MVSRDEIEQIATVSAKAAVTEMFRVLGIDVNDPFAMQRDMAHLRFWRKIFEGAITKVAMAGVIGALAIGIVLLVRPYH
jgi:hypothetical protein